MMQTLQNLKLADAKLRVPTVTLSIKDNEIWQNH